MIDNSSAGGNAMSEYVYLMRGECLEEMGKIQDASIDMVLCDLPYGTTQNKWDTCIDLQQLWSQYGRICRPGAAIVLTASQPFTSSLVMSNPKMFRHEWIWIKNRAGNFANSNREPFKEHESVLVFSSGNWTYNMQMQERAEGGAKRAAKQGVSMKCFGASENYGIHKVEEKFMSDLRKPSSHQEFNVERGLHPNQKPVSLMEYLIKTYTTEGMTVLDNCMGSGTTGVACIKTGRGFVGIERDSVYFNIAEDRIQNEQSGVLWSN